MNPDIKEILIIGLAGYLISCLAIYLEVSNYKQLLAEQRKKWLARGFLLLFLAISTICSIEILVP